MAIVPPMRSATRVQESFMAFLPSLVSSDQRSDRNATRIRSLGRSALQVPHVPYRSGSTDTIVQWKRRSRTCSNHASDARHFEDINSSRERSYEDDVKESLS